MEFKFSPFIWIATNWCGIRNYIIEIHISLSLPYILTWFSKNNHIFLILMIHRVALISLTLKNERKTFGYTFLLKWEHTFDFKLPFLWRSFVMRLFSGLRLVCLTVFFLVSFNSEKITWSYNWRTYAVLSQKSLWNSLIFFSLQSE